MKRLPTGRGANPPNLKICYRKTIIEKKETRLLSNFRNKQLKKKTSYLKTLSQQEQKRTPSQLTDRFLKSQPYPAKDHSLTHTNLF